MAPWVEYKWDASHPVKGDFPFCLSGVSWDAYHYDHARTHPRRDGRSRPQRQSLSLRAKLAETYVRDLLEGRSEDPKLSKILAVANALGKDLAWLIEGEDLSELAAIVRKLPKQSQAEILDFARYKERQTKSDS